MLEGITLLVNGAFLVFLVFVWNNLTDRINRNGRKALLMFGVLILLNVFTLLLTGAN
mgnify:CR=1 FL=1|jgi:hypothetical protein